MTRPRPYRSRTGRRPGRTAAHPEPHTRGTMNSNGAAPAAGRAAFVSALIPVVARVVEVGTGPAAVVALVRAAGSDARRDDRRFVLAVAERLADRLAGGRGHDTVAQQGGQTVRAEGRRAEGGQVGERVVG